MAVGVTGVAEAVAVDVVTSSPSSVLTPALPQAAKSLLTRCIVQGFAQLTFCTEKSCWASTIVNKLSGMDSMVGWNRSQ